MGRVHGPCTTGVHGPCMATGVRNTLPVFMARENCQYSRVVKRCLVHPWIRLLYTGRAHGCLVHPSRVYGPWTRPVLTGCVYGPDNYLMAELADGRLFSIFLIFLMRFQSTRYMKLILYTPHQYEYQPKLRQIEVTIQITYATQPQD